MNPTRFASYVWSDRRVITGGIVLVLDKAHGLYRVQWPGLDRSHNVNLAASVCSCRVHARGHLCLHLIAAQRAARLADHAAVCSIPVYFTDTVGIECIPEKNETQQIVRRNLGRVCRFWESYGIEIARDPLNLNVPSGLTSSQPVPNDILVRIVAETRHIHQVRPPTDPRRKKLASILHSMMGDGYNSAERVANGHPNFVFDEPDYLVNKAIQTIERLYAPQAGRSASRSKKRGVS
ncbi:MAG: hypothetical protein WCF84_05905 [Anaerolineae bacterium]